MMLVVRSNMLVCPFCGEDHPPYDPLPLDPPDEGSHVCDLVRKRFWWKKEGDEYVIRIRQPK